MPYRPPPYRPPPYRPPPYRLTASQLAAQHKRPAPASSDTSASSDTPPGDRDEAEPLTGPFIDQFPAEHVPEEPVPWEATLMLVGAVVFSCFIAWGLLALVGLV